MLTTHFIHLLLARLPGLRIAVLGDLFLDRYLDLDNALTESSLETGLAAYQVIRVRSQPGAAGTVINNLAALGVGTVIPLAIIGDDGEGYELRQALSAMSCIDLAHIYSRSDRRTPTYTKPMLSQADGSFRELNRLDIKNRKPTPSEAQVAVGESLKEVWSTLDALIVLDQVSEADCGVVTSHIRELVTLLADRDPDRFVLGDSRERISQFKGIALKPNAREANDISAIRQASGRDVYQTNGEQGILLYRAGEAKPREIRGYPVTGPVDAVGAGDSVSAAIASAIAVGATPEQAAAFGNLVASITVQQIGTTGTASPQQVLRRWQEVQSK